MPKVRKFPYQEEVKIISSEVFRDGDMTDDEWTACYEFMKETGGVVETAFELERQVKLGYKLAEASRIIKLQLQEGKNKSDVNNL